MTNGTPLLEINDLHVGFRIGDEFYDAVDGVSIDLQKNEILAIVGESGCGKSTLATTIMGLHNPLNTNIKGKIQYKDKELVGMSETDYNKIRGNDIGMIFQDPLASLNPLMTIGAQIDEALYYHTSMTAEERTERVLELLEQVGIPNPKRTFKQYPHELSGGMRQRIVIAIALSCKPPIIIADEPTTALDVTIQAQILDLLNDIQAETGSGIILITHDLGVVAETADRVAVMYGGQFVEVAPVEELFTNPRHPYTRSLLKSNPQSSDEGGDLHVINGVVPPLTKMPRTGCRFAPRIPWIGADAHEVNPTMHEVSAGHFVRCTCHETFYFEGETN
ncbi:dipeptide/oligopeptide/nickel ABC transporter ATP-binding protein [Streptococcus azizii]|uniref:Dipeptide/oligopeptide/nickel ABC transporter ATP-binding protein n=1 Tax=Streptococcus azizii TaxID=1579424 RepID=A0AB36JQ38_9STRE|nr:MULTISPECIES: ABC transporter ATP-binding protein [Streptococcus]MBF0776434.1 ABC transporter ATP-binding protein [Streptococcus sp. 19428wD3_AN2]ONK25780.1 dipeptide/oligopeptide/nickel ABC transporter ATP-binding protein [Streptococcus azizii]ONK30576.1 dipeptide/oligopeptide/nickel ABC transporter ATP-binding protein [Streptococcus azizii]ONK30945.1 dipeptide/oligopeptide/nickel ABC transporter ATP-binding protein [Streptococcus azizii]TFU83063.1 ABC transporter ATP-binding protein [Stre